MTWLRQECSQGHFESTGQWHICYPLLLSLHITCQVATCGSFSLYPQRSNSCTTPTVNLSYMIILTMSSITFLYSSSPSWTRCAGSLKHRYFKGKVSMKKYPWNCASIRKAACKTSLHYCISSWPNTWLTLPDVGYLYKWQRMNHFFPISQKIQ